MRYWRSFLIMVPFSLEGCGSRDCLQVDDDDADGFIIARVLEELQKRSTGKPFDELRWEKLCAESLLLRGTIIGEVEEDRVQCFGVNTIHVPRYVNVLRFVLRRYETATNEHPGTVGLAQQPQRRFQFRELTPPISGCAETFNKRGPRRGMNTCGQSSRRLRRRKDQHNDIIVF